MSNQEINDLGNTKLREYRERFKSTPGYPNLVFDDYDMLAFHQQGIREGLTLILKDLFDPEDSTLLEEDQFGYHLLAIKDKYTHLLP